MLGKINKDARKHGHRLPGEQTVHQRQNMARHGQIGSRAWASSPTLVPVGPHGIAMIHLNPRPLLRMGLLLRERQTIAIVIIIGVHLCSLSFLDIFLSAVHVVNWSVLCNLHQTYRDAPSNESADNCLPAGMAFSAGAFLPCFSSCMMHRGLTCCLLRKKVCSATFIMSCQACQGCHS